MNNKTIFPEFSDSSRIWIYGFENQLTESQISIVDDALNHFMDSWNAHGIPVRGGFSVIYDQFVILCPDANQNVSGCSIDSSVKVFKSLNKKHAINALNQNLVYYKDNQQVKAVPRDEFQQLINNNSVNQSTIVFNNTIQSLKEFRENRWEVSVINSWHANAFQLNISV